MKRKGEEDSYFCFECGRYSDDDLCRLCPTSPLKRSGWQESCDHFTPRTISREDFENWMLEEMDRISGKLSQYCPESPYLTMCVGLRADDTDNLSGACWNDYYNPGVTHAVCFRTENGRKIG